MDDFDKCCGLNVVDKIFKFKYLFNIFRDKHKNIINTKSKTVLTSCLGCKTILNLFSFGKYKSEDLIEFLAKNVKQL